MFVTYKYQISIIKSTLLKIIFYIETSRSEHNRRPKLSFNIIQDLNICKKIRST